MKGIDKNKMMEQNIKEIKNTKSKKVFIIISSILVLIIVLFAAIFISNSAKKKSYKKHIEVSKKYLDDLDYELAIAELDEAISIDAKREDAYLLKSDAYIGLKEYDEARSVLQDAVDFIGKDNVSDELLSRLQLLSDENMVFISHASWIDDFIALYRKADGNTPQFEIVDFIKNIDEVMSWYQASSGKMYYFGDVKDGIPNGFGVAVFSDGGATAYVGDFKNGKRDGNGMSVFIRTDNISGYYLGEWADGRPEGAGNEYYYVEADDVLGYRVEGYSVNGKMEGKTRQYFYFENPEDNNTYYYEYLFKAGVPQKVGGVFTSGEYQEDAYAILCTYGGYVGPFWHEFAGILCSDCDAEPSMTVDHVCANDVHMASDYHNFEFAE